MEPNGASNFSLSLYDSFEGERWTIWVRIEDGKELENGGDIFIVNNITGNWQKFDGYYTKFPYGYKFMLEWENTHPDKRKEYGWRYSWMSYPDCVGQRIAMADPNHWL